MKTLQSLFVLSTASLIVNASYSQQSSPNIIIILMDDMGYGDIGTFGAIQYHTPNIDKLEKDGMRFTNFYASQAISSASRASLMTGCYANRIGIKRALSPKSTIGLNHEEETIAEILKKRDYSTIAIGKWHLGHHMQFLPLQHGFDKYLGIPYSNDMWPIDYDGIRASVESNPQKASYPELPLIRNNEKICEFNTLEDQSTITTLYTEKAVEYIKKTRHKPFFMYLAHSMTHVPLAVSDKFKGKSKQGMYGDVMMEIDWSVAEIVRTLEECGLTQNTLIVFTSDNGPWLSFGNHAGSAGGLREGKRTSWEGGPRVPCLMKWPNVIPPGTVCSNIASTIDLLPTFAAITNAPIPNKKIDGISILPLLKGNFSANPRDHLFFYFSNSLEAVRKDNWKLVFPHKGRTYEGFEPGNDGFRGETNENFSNEGGLFDLRRDPGERYNLKDFYPEKVKELEKLAQEARDDMGDDLTGNPGKNRREPGRIK